MQFLVFLKTNTFPRSFLGAHYCFSRDAAFARLVYNIRCHLTLSGMLARCRTPAGSCSRFARQAGCGGRACACWARCWRRGWRATRRRATASCERATAMNSGSTRCGCLRPCASPAPRPTRPPCSCCSECARTAPGTSWVTRRLSRGGNARFLSSARVLSR